jgi:hypothetical protein
MVDTFRCLTPVERRRGSRDAGTMATCVLLCLGTAGVLFAEGPGVHYAYQGVMPPGAIGSRQLQRGGPLPGFFQPVEIKAPPGALISLAEAGQFGPPHQSAVRAGMLIGQVYRLRLMSIPLHPGAEVFPTVEVIDRLYAPVDQQRRFAIPVELTQVDLQLAIQGKFVTRVIYLEDPQRALPVRQDHGEQNWFEVAPGRDPLAVADALGRPVAILRLGARLPDQGPDANFFFGCPPYVLYPARKEASPKVEPNLKILPPPPKQPAEAPLQEPAAKAVEPKQAAGPPQPQAAEGPQP